MAPVHRYLALCPRPTEPLCAAELTSLPGVSDVRPGAGLVSFSGGLEALYRANLHLRTATRVLVPLASFPCHAAGDLYEGAREVPWEAFLRPAGTLAVSAHGTLPALGNTMFTAQRVKDAVVDRFRQRTGRRPDVDPRDPDLRINVQLSAGPDGPRCDLALDSSADALHRRGYRQGGGAAPLKENLAASILLLTGYRGGVPLCDPCCGSGTLLIEGGLIALRRAPGLMRGFGFQRWRDYDAGLFARLQEEARAQALPAEGVFLHGGDNDAAALRLAERGAAAAGLAPCARLICRDLADARPPKGEPGIVVCNPPYGERLGEADDLAPLYRALGDVLKRHFTGYTAYVFTANLALAKQIGLRPRERHVLYNGNLEGRLLRFDLY